MQDIQAENMLYVLSWCVDAYIVYFPPCSVEITSPVARYDKKCHMSDAEKKIRGSQRRKERRSRVKREHSDEEKEEGTKK